MEGRISLWIIIESESQSEIYIIILFRMDNINKAFHAEAVLLKTNRQNLSNNFQELAFFY